MLIKTKLNQGSATTLLKNSSSWLNLNDQAGSISIFLREELEEEHRTSNHALAWLNEKDNNRICSINLQKVSK